MSRKHRELGLSVVAICALASSAVAAATYSIAPEKVDSQKVFFGMASGFDKAGGIDYETVVMATPEYEEVMKKKIEPGTGKYWILMSQASDRAVRAISEVGHESGYDFIAAQTYLSALDPVVPCEDITQLVVDKLNRTGGGRDRRRS